MKLAPEAETELRRACDRLRRRGTVNIDYGFDKKLPYGRGLSVLLYGPSGTGKTMAAKVMANDLGLDLYCIDLAQISSKYIGETEKNLTAFFDAARYSNAILFFDEADALFAKRTDVSTSNDRHANAETAFLLQKVEEYPGVTILATNHTQNFDPAFRRRDQSGAAGRRAAFGNLAQRIPAGGAAQPRDRSDAAGGAGRADGQRHQIRGHRGSLCRRRRGRRDHFAHAAPRHCRRTAQVRPADRGV